MFRTIKVSCSAERLLWLTMTAVKKPKGGEGGGEENPRFDYFFELPEHTQYTILSAIDARSLCRFACASHSCNSVVAGDNNLRAAALWHDLCLDLLGPAVCGMHSAFGTSVLKKGIKLDGLPAGSQLPACPAFWKKLYRSGVRPTDLQYWRGGGEHLRSSLIVNQRRSRVGQDPSPSPPREEVQCLSASLPPSFGTGPGVRGMSSIDPHVSTCAGLERQATVDQWPLGKLSPVRPWSDLLQVLDAIARTGHTATQVGSLQVVIGGLALSGQTMMDVVVVDMETMSIFWPEVCYADNCAPPPTRFRHTATLIAHPSGSPAIFILGGYNMEGAEYGAEDTYLLHVIRSGRRVTWQRVRTSGQVPTPRFHHVTSAFNGGRKLVVYGGEGSHSDDHVEVPSEGGGGAGPPAMQRSDQIAVYIMDVSSMSWRKVATHGAGPGSRSLSMGCTSRDAKTGKERLVLTGGFMEFERDLAELHVFALDLETFEWTAGPCPPGGTASLPRTRHRAGCGRVGPDSLLIFGGGSKNNTGSFYSDCLLLHLPSLTWSSSSLKVHGEPTVGPTAGHSLQSLLIFGGCLAGNLGITPVARMDPLLLGYWGDVGSLSAGTAAAAEPVIQAGGAAALEKQDHIPLRQMLAVRSAINVDPRRWPQNIIHDSTEGGSTCDEE